jgi:hypothetical protein
MNIVRLLPEVRERRRLEMIRERNRARMRAKRESMKV